MEKNFPKLFASVKDRLIAKKEIVGNNNQTIATIGDEFIVVEIVEYGFDLKSVEKPEILIRFLNSELKEHFNLKK